MIFTSKKSKIYANLILVSLITFEEFSQVFFYSRNSSLADLAADYAGLIFFGFIATKITSGNNKKVEIKTTNKHFTFNNIKNPLKMIRKFDYPKFALSFAYAFAGIKHLFSSQQNMRIHLIISILAVGAGFALKIEHYEWFILIFTICMVFMAEAVNTIAEYLVDLISPTYNKIAGIVKDVAAGAVLISSIFAIVIGLILFLPKVLSILN